ncbi:MAG: hypothetical protein M3441_27270, partial [Chloroflexota bacterium]|nr:hypothetical protein [Chloroflexota bacterium]
LPIAEPERVVHELAQADLIATAVRPENLPYVAPVIAAGLQRRRRPVNVLAFENLANAGLRVRHLVGNHLASDAVLAAHGFGGVLVSRTVTQCLIDPDGATPLIFVGDPPASFVVEGAQLCQPLPPIEGMIVTDNYPAWIQRKLYTYSAGHATTAYLGYLQGYRYIHTAIRDGDIRAAVLAAMAEGQRGLAVRYGSELAGSERDLLDILARFENVALADPIVRVGCDPCRKLGPHDRLVGAASLAEAAGMQPCTLARAAAAALCFHHPADPSAVRLQHLLQTAGLHATLQHISGLDSKRGVGRLVAESWRQIPRGLRQGNTFSSPERRMWASCL